MNNLPKILRGVWQPTSLMLGSAIFLGHSLAVAQVEPPAPKANADVVPTVPNPPQGAADNLPATPPSSTGSSPVDVTEKTTPAVPAATTGLGNQGESIKEPVTSASGADAMSPAVAANPESEQADADAQLVAEEMSDEPSKINIYGFMDFTYAHGLSDRKSFVQYVPYPSFYVGNLNLYLDSNLGHNFRSLAEVRFAYLPNGAETGIVTRGAVGRTSSITQDYIDFRRTEKVGGIIIQRAWVEYAAHPLLTARVGQWLTPYGIWNVDHGSTVVIPVSRPYIIGDELFPQRQTGIELYGSTGFESTQVGYHLTLSNGRGPVDEYRDFDKNKAIGWRLWVQQDTSFGTFGLGTSGYKGRYTDRTHMQNVTMEGAKAAISNEYTAVSSYNELGLALDVRWTWKGALVQSEAIMHDVAYIDPARPVAIPGPGLQADAHCLGVYALAGYRLPWLGIMPFYGYEFYRAFGIDAASVWGGLNIRPTDRVVLKVQETHVWFPNGFGSLVTPPDSDYLFAQIAWSF